MLHRNLYFRYGLFGLLIVFMFCSCTFRTDSSEVVCPPNLKTPSGQNDPINAVDYCLNNLPKLLADGHLYTTYIIAKISGMTDEKAYALTYYSQYPDIDKNYEATPVGIRYALWPFAWKWRKDVMAELHSLNGKGGKELRMHRERLANLIYQGLEKKNR